VEKLDLHGVRHHEVDLMVENFIFLNQHDIPLTIICGSSSKMVELVKVVLDRAGSDYLEGKGFDFGRITVLKL
ncbi:uncharacterized protein METZ01_LOCUS85465, partial [marine metagenome]|jgi:hypothetical protein|tara:strand:+ start:87 stop:305 length:219 start_codon:yes stop_codon:yes gene_type:complete